MQPDHFDPLDTAISLYTNPKRIVNGMRSYRTLQPQYNHKPVSTKSLAFGHTYNGKKTYPCTSAIGTA